MMSRSFGGRIGLFPLRQGSQYLLALCIAIARPASQLFHRAKTADANPRFRVDETDFDTGRFDHSAHKLDIAAHASGSKSLPLCLHLE